MLLPCGGDVASEQYIELTVVPGTSFPPWISELLRQCKVQVLYDHDPIDVGRGLSTQIAGCIARGATPHLHILVPPSRKDLAMCLWAQGSRYNLHDTLEKVLDALRSHLEDEAKDS